MIEFRDVTRRFGDVVAVKDLDFEVDKGEVVGLLGANGAGKTTAMRLMTGYYQPSEGEVRVGGQLVQRNPLSVKKKLGYLPEKLPLYDEMITREYLRYVADLKGVESGQVDRNLDRVVEQLQIAEQVDRLIGNLSRGYRQRVALAQALIHDPEFLVLDEPTLGLDPVQVRRLRELIGELAEETTLVISSHILPEVNEICNRVIILKDGEMVAVDTPESLSRKQEGNAWTLELASAPSDWSETLESIDPVVSVESIGEATYRLVFEGDDRSARQQVFDLCAEHEAPLIELSRDTMDLEDIFIELTEQDDAAEGIETEATVNEPA
jgi:ABC-2 type transport system ATP-binding protein